MTGLARVSAVAAPWAVVPTVVIAGLGSSDGGVAGDFLMGLLFGSFLGVPISYAATLIYGVPVFLLLRKFRRVNAWTLSLAGIAPGLLLGAIYADLRLLFIIAACGGSVAIAAWLIMRSDYPPKGGMDGPHCSGA